MGNAMSKDIHFRIRGTTLSEQEQLKEKALQLTGKRSVSALAKKLLFEQGFLAIKPPALEVSAEQSRFEIRLASQSMLELERQAKQEGMTLNSYVTMLLYGYTTKEPQLTTNAVRAIRESNFQLYKIGSNLNQVAKALNMQEATGDRVKISAIETLQAVIQKHMEVVHPLIEKNYNQL